MSGIIKLSENLPTETINFDLRVRDEDTGKVYWFDNYRVTVFYGYNSKSFEEETITGRFYDPEFGYIDVNTVTPIRT